jgi:hypothetical protein
LYQRSSTITATYIIITTTSNTPKQTWIRLRHFNEQDDDDDEEQSNDAEAPQIQGRDDEWVFPTSKKNQNYLVSFMRFANGEQYNMNHQFTKPQLLAIKPYHVCRWLNQLAYHTPTPGHDDRPISYRSGSSKKAKGDVAFFHPNKHAPWVEPHGGNPTIHRSITELIMKVKKFETRGQGKKAEDWHPYTREEFGKMVELFRLRLDTPLFICHIHTVAKAFDPAANGYSLLPCGASILK